MTEIRILKYDSWLPATMEDHYQPGQTVIAKMKLSQIVEGLCGFVYIGQDRSGDAPKYVYEDLDGNRTSYSTLMHNILIKNNLWKADHNLWLSQAQQLRDNRPTSMKLDKNLVRKISS